MIHTAELGSNSTNLTDPQRTVLVKVAGLEGVAVDAEGNYSTLGNALTKNFDKFY